MQEALCNKRHFLTFHTGVIMNKARLASIFAATAIFSVQALAQNTPVGKWHNVDDKTKEIKAEITILEAGGALSGKITKRLLKDAKPDDVCDECKDARKGQLILGMEIIRGAKKDATDDVWTGGKILDPENGKEYSLKLTPLDGGKKLAVRGFIGSPLFGRSQTWVRVE
jgi:uncharacterized protein (DUF2147 family)